MQCRLSATIRCLSHPSAHVRALSTAILRDIIHSSSTTSANPAYRLTTGFTNWLADIDKCLKWEAHSRRATGLTLSFLDSAATELGCPLHC